MDDTNTESVIGREYPTETMVLDHVKSTGVSGKAYNTLSRVLGEMGVKAFVDADCHPADYWIAYRKVRPDSKTGVGNTYRRLFHDTVEWILQWSRDQKAERKTLMVQLAEDAARRRIEEEARMKAEKEAAEAAEAEKRRLNPIFSRMQLQRVLDYMTLENFNTIDLSRVNDFFKLFPEEPVQESQNKEGE